MAMEASSKKSTIQTTSKSPAAQATKVVADSPKVVTLSDLINREVTVQLKDREEQTFIGTLVELSQWGPVLSGTTRGKKFLDLIPWHQVSFVSSVEARASDNDDE